MVPDTFTDDEVLRGMGLLISRASTAKVGTVNGCEKVTSGNPFVGYNEFVKWASEGRYFTESESDGDRCGVPAGAVSRLSWRVFGCLLSALVVREKDYKVGNGFFTMAEDLGLTVPDRDRFWNEQVCKCVRLFGKVVP